MKIFALILFFHKISQIFSLTSYLLNEDIENCKYNESLSYLDFSSIKFTIINDSLTVVDGKLIVTENIKRPWQSFFFGERYERGTWIRMLQKTMPDFCNHILNPMEP